MALIAHDGFDYYASTGDLLNRQGPALRWSSSPVYITSGRVGGQGVAVQGYNPLTGVLGSPITTAMYVGFAFNLANYYGATQTIFNCGSLSMSLNQTNASVTVDGVSSNNNLFNPVAWNFVELGVTAISSSASLIARLNGQTVLTQTGINTLALLGSSISTFNITTNSNPNSQGIDDFYICDGTTGPGSYPNNTFLGDFRTATQQAIGNNSVAWTPSAGTNWQEVQWPQDGDTTYNRSNTVGASDYLNFGALASDLGEVNGLQVTVMLRKEDAGARTVAPVVYIGGTAYVGPAQTLGTGYAYLTNVWPVNPATNTSWTTSAINAAAFGYTIVS